MTLIFLKKRGRIRSCRRLSYAELTVFRLLFWQLNMAMKSTQCPYLLQRLIMHCYI